MHLSWVGYGFTEERESTAKPTKQNLWLQTTRPAGHTMVMVPDLT